MMKQSFCGLGVMIAASVWAAQPLAPELQREFTKRGVDAGDVVRIEIPGGFDVSDTVKDSTNKFPKAGQGRTEWSCVRIIPPCMYTGAKVRFSVDPDKKKDHAFTLRITRYVDNPKDGWVGRAYDAMCNVLVETDKVAKREIGKVKVGDRDVPLYETEVAIDTGDILGILRDDYRGTYLYNEMGPRTGAPIPMVTDIGNYLDLDLLGRLPKYRNPLEDAREKPDPEKPSAIRVHSVELTKSPAMIGVRQLQPGNVFHNDEKPETQVSVDVAKPGAYTLVWTITNPEGKAVARAERSVRADATFTVDLRQKELGWYGLTYELFDGGKRLLTHHASFVLLGEDTRTSGTGEGPYGSWAWGANHYTMTNMNVLGSLLLKAGLRRSDVRNKWKPEEYHAWKVSPGCLELAPRDMKKPEGELVKYMRAQREQDPNLKSFFLMWEYAPWPYQQAPEIAGLPYGEEFAWLRWGHEPHRDLAFDAEDAQKRYEDIMARSNFLRKHFPEVRITIGNSVGSTLLVSEAVRLGFPEKNADYMGLETVVRTSKPERQCEATIQAADLMRQLGEKIGYKSWKVNSCVESCYRLADLLGDDRTAAWYVRDILVSQSWGMPDIATGNLCDAGNRYASSFWGGAGLCHRMPYLYPRKSYAGIAVATKMLDMVTDAKRIDCGDPCVFVMDFTRRDGKHVWAMWTSRGTAEIAFDLDDAVAATDFYGRDVAPLRDEGGLFSRIFTHRHPVVKADGFVRYFLGEAGAVASARVGARTYPEDVQPAGAKLVAATDSAAQWKPHAGKIAEKEVERPAGSFLPFRTAGKCVVREVVDEERGKCLELELVEPNLSLPECMFEYGVIELEKPIPLTGDPASLGAWVKGNSGWGNFCWIVEREDGRRCYSFGKSLWGDSYDHEGNFSLDFTGWAFLKIGIQEWSSVRAGTLSGIYGGNWVGDGGDPSGPLKLVGVALVAQNRPLSLTKRAPMKQKMRIGGVFAFDYKK